VQVDAVTASIDPNITAENIKSGVSILGVTGTYKDLGAYKQILEMLRGGFSSSHTMTYFTDDIVDEWGIATQLGAYALAYSASRRVVLPSVTTSGSDTFSHADCEEVVCESWQTHGPRPFDSCMNLKKIVTAWDTVGSNVFRYGRSIEWFEFGVVTTFSNLFVDAVAALYNCKAIVVGQDTDIDLNLSRWTATNVIAEGPSGEAELNYNIKTYLADRVKDNSGGGPTRTITFGTALYNVLTADTIAAFTDKGWSVAYA